jgi:cytochrome P450
MADEASQWLRRRGLFREVIGYREAVAMLTHGSLRVVYVFLAEEGAARGLQEASLLSTDGEVHRQIRAAVAGLFTPKAVKSTRSYARDVADELSAVFVSQGTGDLVARFARPYVQTTMARFVGLPSEEIGSWWPGVETIARAKDSSDFERGGLLLAEYAESVFKRAQSHLGEGMVAVLAELVDSGSLSERQAVALIATLLSAGHEPTINQIALMVSLLSHHSEVWDAIHVGDLDASAVVEAALRFCPTNRGVIRRVAEPLEVDDVALAPGDVMLVNTAAANRDPREFDDPDNFWVGEESRHLAFGLGTHYCLGAALARVQLGEALSALTSRMTCPTVHAEHVVDGGGLLGLESLVLDFTARVPD